MTSIKPSIKPSHTVGTATGIAPISSFLAQADVCREQAREAAHLKRYKSSLGLFATASALCRYVLTKGEPSDAALASERLKSLSVEMASYSELARGAHRSTK